MMELRTTTACVNAARELLKDAHNINSQWGHASWSDQKVGVLQIVNNALESGGFTGEAYDELWQAKRLLNEAESVAGRYVND
ncbi:hypothetical protein [Bacillus phage SBSphiJ6]|nr:hypothetical protein [Bacillus phage SBSphiJ6]